MDRHNAYAQIARRLGGELTGARRLEGGVSADVWALDLRRTDGSADTVVLRQHQVHDWKPLEADVTAIEHNLLAALSALGFAVPTPYLLDDTAAVLPAPYLVMAFVEGTTSVAPDALPAALIAMADFLAALHAVDTRAVAHIPLPDRGDPLPEVRVYLPADSAFDDVRSWLAENPSLPRPIAPALLHGDFWPGNILWRGGTLAAVIDWEDAAIGDPLADLATCRLELAWRYGQEAVSTLSDRYVATSGTTLDTERLSLWELCAGSGALATMAEWGLDSDIEAQMRAQANTFIRRAAARLTG